MTLVVNGLCYGRSKKLLFDQLTFDVLPGEALHIIGPNGVGKTSLLQILTGLVAPLSGRVLWNDIPVCESSEFKENVLYISHRLGMRSTLTPFENLYLFLLRRSLRRVNKDSCKEIKKRARENINAALTTLGLTSCLNTLTGLLSPGQQKRLLLAKLLLVKTACWIVDEPFTALDSEGVTLTSFVIEEQLRRGGMVILTSHQPFSVSNGIIKRLFLGSVRVH